MRKQTVYLLLFFLLLLQPMASASVLVEGWQQASEADLLNAQLQLEEHLRVLQMSGLDDAETVTISGTGTSIRDGIVLNNVPARVHVEGEASNIELKGSFGNMLLVPGSRNSGSITEPGEILALVTSQGDWKITIEPIKQGASFPLSGKGDYVGELMYFPDASVLVIDVNGKSATDLHTPLYASFTLRGKNKGWDGWESVYLFSTQVYPGQTPSPSEVFFIPNDNFSGHYFLEVSADSSIEWTIKVKE